MPPDSSPASPEVLHVSPARQEAAAALRRLGHAIGGHHVPDDFFHRVIETVERVLPEIESAPRRSRPIGAMKRWVFGQAPEEGINIDHFPDCVVSGTANPMGVGIKVHREGDVAVSRLTLGAAFEGAPGRAHGGIVAALFDDVMGNVLMIHGTAAFTGRLTISYLAPTPVGVELEVRAWLRERQGRKLFIDAAAFYEGEKIAEADALFIEIPRERLAAIPDE